MQTIVTYLIWQCLCFRLTLSPRHVTLIVRSVCSAYFMCVAKCTRHVCHCNNAYSLHTPRSLFSFVFHWLEWLTAVCCESPAKSTATFVETFSCFFAVLNDNQSFIAYMFCMHCNAISWTQLLSLFRSLLRFNRRKSRRLCDVVVVVRLRCSSLVYLPPHRSLPLKKNLNHFSAVYWLCSAL